MVGILASVLAGGVGGGARAYEDIMDDRRDDKLEARKAAMLELRQKSLARYQADLQAEARGEERAYREGKENREDADARMAASILSGKEIAPGILGSTGGDEYAVPMSKDDMKESMSGKGLLALTEAEMKLKAKKDEMIELINDKGETIFIKKGDTRPKGYKSIDAFKAITGRQKADAEKGKAPKISASEKKRLQEESDRILTGLIPEYDPETKTIMIDQAQAEGALSALKSNGYPNAKIQKSDTKSKFFSDDVTTVTISAGRFDHSAIGKDEEKANDFGELKPFVAAIQNNDFDTLGKMTPKEFDNYATKLSSQLGITKAELVREIEARAKKAGYGAEGKPEPEPIQEEKPKPVVPQPKEESGLLLPGVPKTIKKVKDTLTDKDEWQKMVDFANQRNRK